MAEGWVLKDILTGEQTEPMTTSNAVEFFCIPVSSSYTTYQEYLDQRLNKVTALLAIVVKQMPEDKQEIIFENLGFEYVVNNEP